MIGQNVFLSVFNRVWRRCVWSSLVLWLVLAGAAEAVEIRVAIQKQANRLKVGSSTTALVRDGQGRVLGEISSMNAFYAQNSGGGIALGQWRSGQLWVEPSGDGYVWIGDRWYRGKTRLVREGGSIRAINHVDLEEYLYSVVGGEMVASWPLEALKAQAVAARSYALHKRSLAANRLFDLDGTTTSQVYKGLASEASSTHQAVGSTAGQVMTYNGGVILAVFHSSSGGHTENVEDVWSKPLPYLRGVVDYDQQSPVFQWTKTISASELGRLAGNIGTVKSVTAERLTPRGRVVSLKLVGDRGTKSLTGKEFRQLLQLRSSLFTITPVDNYFYLVGRGFGHGVGMSQWGAHYLAQQGINYQSILGHYYQGTKLSLIEER